MLCMPTHGLYISLSYRQRINLQVNTITTDDSTTCTVLLSTNYCKLIQEGQSYPRKQTSRKKSKYFVLLFSIPRGFSNTVHQLAIEEVACIILFIYSFCL